MGGCSYVFVNSVGLAFWFPVGCRGRASPCRWRPASFPVWPGSGGEGWFLVEGAVFEHAVDHVASASGEADDGGVVVFALFAFAFVVGDRGRMFGAGDERGLP